MIVKVGLWGEGVGWVSELGEPQMEGMDADVSVLRGMLVWRGVESHGFHGWAGRGCSLGGGGGDGVKG